MIQVNLRAGPIDLWHVVAILSQEIKKLCLWTASFVLSTRLAVHKQSFSNLLRQNGRHMTKVYSSSSCAFSLTLLHGWHTSCQNFIHHMTKKEPEPYVTYYHDICFGYSILKEMVNVITKIQVHIRKKSEIPNAGYGLMQYYPLLSPCSHPGACFSMQNLALLKFHLLVTSVSIYSH